MEGSVANIGSPAYDGQDDTRESEGDSWSYPTGGNRNEIATLALNAFPYG